MNNAAFAEMLGVGRSTLGDWYSGKNKPEPETVEGLLNSTAKHREAFAKNVDAMFDFIAVNTPGECD